MKPSKLYEALHALIGERVPLHIWGACGVGKSQIVAQVANDLDFDFLDVRAVQLDPVDLRGFTFSTSTQRCTRLKRTNPDNALTSIRSAEEVRSSVRASNGSTRDASSLRLWSF